MVIRTDPSRRDLLTFGIALPFAMALLGYGVGHLADSATVRNAAWVGGGALSAVYLAVPPLRRAIFVGFSRVTYPIGWVVSHVVLAAVFFAVVTPIGLVMRPFRRDPMGRRFRTDAHSYWAARAPAPDPERYFHQF